MSSPNAEVPQAVAVKPNPRNIPAMFIIFQNVQYNVVQHKKYVKEMIKLYEKHGKDRFCESFKNAVLYLFTLGDVSANVDRVVQFVATFCTTLDEQEEFLLVIFDIILDCQCVSGPSVRYRSTQLLAAVMFALGPDASLDEDLCDKLLASLMQRLQDTHQAVRCRAVLALERLQNPMEEDDAVTRAYRFHMSNDPSSSVRRAVVKSIAKCRRNVPLVLERLCDVDEAVRRAAFLYITAFNVTQLRISQRVLTLKVGLTERSHRVRRVVEEILIPGWLSTFKGNILELLKAIRLDNAQDAKDSEYVAGKLLESIFKRLPISELLIWLPTDESLRLIPVEKLNKESAWYWRHLAEHLHKTDDGETLETVLPDLVQLTGYIRAIVESPCPSETEDPVDFRTRQCVLHELATMLRVYDAADPAGRSALHALITDVLTGDYGLLNADVIRAFVSALELVVPEVSDRMEVINGVIQSLRTPPEPDQSPPLVGSAEAKWQIARLRVSLNVAIEAQEQAVRKQNYDLAAECKTKVDDIQTKLDEMFKQPTAPAPASVPIPIIREKLSDAATLTKCLTILNFALDTPQLNTVTPIMQKIFHELEAEIFQNPEIIETALVTVALFGMLDKKFAVENKVFFFTNLIDTSKESTVSTVLRCIADLLCVHGANLFETESNQEDATVNTANEHNTSHSVIDDDDGRKSESAISVSPAHGNVIELLLAMMDSAKCAPYRPIIVECLCRLLHLGRLESPAVLSRLLLLWFNPDTGTDDEDMMKQIIGVFFETFPTAVDGAQKQILKATLPTLRALANAPSRSTLADIDAEAVVRFIVSLTRVSNETSDSQGSMALVLCRYIAQRPEAPEVALASRVLARLGTPRDAVLVHELAHMLRELCLELSDQPSCRNLKRYLDALEAAEQINRNRISDTGITEGVTMQEDSLAPLGRTMSSMPPPIEQSTHVVVNDTDKEEPEIEETVPISAGPSHVPSDSISGVSPANKAKVTKGKKKKQSVTRQTSGSDSSKPTCEKTGQGKKNAKEGNEKGVTRTSLLRPPVHVEIAPSKPVRTTRSCASSRPSRAGPSHWLGGSGDTMPHTIVHEQEIAQSVLKDSNKLAKTRRGPKSNVTLPEEPGASEESAPEPDVPKKTKPKGKKKK